MYQPETALRGLDIEARFAAIGWVARPMLARPTRSNMSLLVFLFFGFFVGIVARALMPGRQHLSLLMTTGLGAVGSLLGGLLGNVIAGEALARVQPAGVLGSVLGAIVLLVVAGGRSRLRT
jgi:uncharacterized membrane protein YeaQ/YmgE (transglycosylase-associated protein family)